MFEDIRQYDRLDLFREARNVFEVCDHRLVEAPPQVVDPIRIEFESDAPAEVGPQRFAQLSAGGAQIQQRSARGESPDQIQENSMTAAFEVLVLINVRHSGLSRFWSAAESRSMRSRCDSIRKRQQAAALQS